MPPAFVSSSTISPNSTHAFVLPCDDRINHPRLTPAPPRAPPNCSSVFSNPPHGHHVWYDCSTTASPHHAAGHSICGNCDDDTAREPTIANAAAAIRRITPERQPPRWDAAAIIRRDTGFLTRLCARCEHWEQEYYWERCSWWFDWGSMIERRRLPNATPTTSYEVAGRMQWPRNRCTCILNVNSNEQSHADYPYRQSRTCIRDQIDAINNVMPALVAARDANDLWLQSIALDSNGRLCQASARRIRTRRSMKNSTFSACRCGAEVDTMGKEEVLLCMACEGIVFQKVPRPLLTPEHLIPPTNLFGCHPASAGGPERGPPPPQRACPTDLPISRFKLPFKDLECIGKRRSKYRRDVRTNPPTETLGRPSMPHEA